METSQQTNLVEELGELIEKGNAHVTFDEAVAGLPPGLRTQTPENLPYSIWQLVEHIRIAQKDIVDFSVSDEYESLNWPDDYWPEPTKNISDEQWERSLREIKADRARFLRLLQDEKRDLHEPFHWGDGQTLLREALLIADHTAYHTAEIVVLRRLLKCWK